MYNLRRTLRTITKAPKLGVFTAIGAVIVLTMLLAACPEDPPAGPAGPSSPTNLVVEISDSQAELTWDAVAGATEYRIYSVGSDGTLTRVAEGTTITDTTYTVTGLTNNTTYRYVVRAVNSAGIESGDSGEISATPELTIPPVPKNLTANPADTQVTLSWTASNSAEEYRIYRASTPDGTLARIAEGTTITETNYIDTGLTNDTTYRYTVRAFNSIGESTDSTEVTATPVASTVVPPAPANLTATAGDTEISLSWDAVPGATEYRIFRAATATDPLARIAENDTIIVTTYTDTGLTNGTTYRYTVRAVNNIGEGIDSSEATAAPALAAPAAPTNLSATATASGQVTLTWDATDNTAEYQVFRADTADGDLVRIADTTTITDPTYTDTGLANDTAYRYTVRAANAAGASPASSEASVTTLALPAAPANFSATPGDTQVLLSWDAVTGATEYRIYRAATANGALTRVTTNSDITGTTYTDTGLTNGTAYRYTVRAVDSVGESIDSNEVSATPVAATVAPPAPANLNGTAGNAQIALSWNAAANATEYYVYRAVTPGLFTRIADAATITDTAYTDTGLTNGTVYYYFVRAINSAGAGTGSNEIRIPLPAVPAVPANLRVVPGDTAVALAWNAAANAAEYRVYRADTTSGPLTRIAASTTITDTAYTDTGLTNGTAYRYTVRAVNIAGESNDSTEVTGTPAALTVAPTAPSNLSAVASNTQAVLTWDAVPSITEYRIYRAGTSSGTLTRIASAATITDTTYTDTGLTNLTTYRYIVRAVNSVSEGADSNEVTARPDDHSNVRSAATVATSGTAITGTVDYSGDRDYFSIHIPAATSAIPVVLHASTTGSTDTFGELYDSSGRQLVVDSNNGAGNNFAINYRIEVSGTYYILARGSSASTGPYSLTISTSTLAVDDHSDVLGITATPLTSGTAVAGSLETARDHDYFSIVITGVSTLNRIRLTAATTGTTDTVGTVYNSAGTQIRHVTAFQRNFNLSVVISENGTYYVRVRGFVDSSVNVATGDYSLTVTTEDIADDHASELGTGATAVTSGTAVAGSIEVAGDVDFFSIAVTGASSSSPVSLTAGTTGSTDTYGVLFDSDGTQLASNDDGGSSTNFNIVHSITENGTYYIRVGGFANVRTGDYSLTVTTQ